MRNTLDALEATGNMIRAVGTVELTPVKATRGIRHVHSSKRTLELMTNVPQLQALEIASG